MKTEDTGDQAIDRLLHRGMQSDSEAGVTPECLDAETFAAWVEGTLDRSALAMAEAHVAGCARCQSMAAVMIRTAPATAEVLPWWRRSMRSVWLVPLTAGAAAVALWAVVPSRTSAPAPPTSSLSVPAEPSSAEAKAAAPPALADRLEARADAKDTAKERLQTRDERRKAADASNAQAASETRQAAVEKFRSAPADAAPKTASNATVQAKPDMPGTAAGSVAGAAAPAPKTASNEAVKEKSTVPASPVPAATPPPAAAAPARPIAEAVSGRNRETGALLKREADAIREVVSPNSAIRWRLGPGGTIDRTEDGGKTWTRLSTAVVAELTAGASPSPSICWIVGRNGTILRSVDGRTWTRTSFPEPADLIGVEAVDASTAIVTTSDGRRFRTANGGQNWIREPLQDF